METRELFKKRVYELIKWIKRDDIVYIWQLPTFTIWRVMVGFYNRNSKSTNINLPDIHTASSYNDDETKIHLWKEIIV